jgi:hypothetical protein
VQHDATGLEGSIDIRHDTALGRSLPEPAKDTLDRGSIQQRAFSLTWAWNKGSDAQPTALANWLAQASRRISLSAKRRRRSPIPPIP